MENNQKKLILLKDLGQLEYGNQGLKTRFGLYKCFCGNEFKVRISDIKNGKTKSCGCYNKQKAKERATKHNLRNHRLYHIWNGMIQRCNNPKAKGYVNYGGRGIIVYERWLNVENFIEDMYPSFIEGLTIDRINPNGNYEPLNCRWVDTFVQSRNKRVIQLNNTSGYKGVNWHKQRQKWRARITVNYKRICIGYFNNPIEAGRAYDKYVIENNLEHTLNFDRE